MWQKKQLTPLSIASTVTDRGYSLAVVENNKQVLFSQNSVNTANPTENMRHLAKDIERLDLIAHNCSLVLLPGQYQLIVMDALNIPEAEMIKALRWNLKGLSDYDLEDVAIDTCPVPMSASDAQKKMFVAITPLTKLNETRTLFETAFLNINHVTIAEMALKNLLSLIYSKQALSAETPLILLSTCNTMRKLHIFYQNMFYLIRELPPNKVDAVATEEPAELNNIFFEIERSIDFFVNQLNLPDPKYLFFTPGFYRSLNFIQAMGTKLSLTVEMIDLNHYLDIQPALSIEKQHEVFYSIIGALTDTQPE